MKFEEALPLLREGKKFRRRLWGNKTSYVFVEIDNKFFPILNNTFHLFMDGSADCWKPDSGDLFADDWEVVE